MRVLIFSIFFLCSCENNLSLKKSCSFQGFNELKKKSISCKENLSISKVDFSNGTARDIVQGKVLINDSTYSFNVIVDSNKVVDYIFPFLDKDSIDYYCVYKMNRTNIVELEWKKSNRRLFIRKKAISVH